MQTESLQAITKFVETIAAQLPLEVFVFFGMLIDEIFPPIPSLFMLIVAGALAKAQDHSLLFLLFYLGFAGALGKTLGAWILYILGDKGEHFIIKRFGKILGVSHKEISEISGRLNKGWKDILVLFLARAIPIFPTTPVSLICGILKINSKIYLIASFAGTWIRSMIFLYIGYIGLISYKNSDGNWTNAEAITQLILITLLISVWIYYKKRKRIRT
jgi:membrane protein DedA with SNARE-associated domain